MQTMNISLPEQLQKQVDSLIKEEGYASRSEFFRTLLRLYITLRRQETELVEFKKRPLNEIHDKMRREDKYSEAFVKSVTKGLASSSVYANKTSKAKSRRISTET